MNVKHRTLPLMFEQGAPGRQGYQIPACDVPEADLHTLLPAAVLRTEPPALPELSELETIRHFVRLSQRNYAIDVDF